MKFRCQCNHIMVFQTDHLPFDLSLIQRNVVGDEFDKALESITKANMLDEDTLNATTDIFDTGVYTQSLSVYKCPVCGRFHIEDGLGMNTFTSYVKESQSP